MAVRVRGLGALVPVGLFAVAGCATAGGAPLSEPVPTEAGLVASSPGLVEGVRAYKGIPFGAPPVGDLRWKPPQPVEPWDGVRPGDEFGPVCMQPDGQGRVNVSVDLPDSPPKSEDCLYLNVWTAAESSDERRPVMVWIFGGAYYEGAGSSPHNNGDQLAAKGVVLVSFNYRLGPLGFLAHPELTAESPHDASGNYALADAITVLEWVKENIAAFGGDPDNVTIFGESAGAAITGGLVGSPEAEGLFDRAIAESGAWMGLGLAPMTPREQAEQQTLQAAERLGMESLADLRAMPAEDASSQLPRQGMIIDGWIIPEDLSITFAEGRQNAVDVIVGANREEGSFTAGFGPPMTAENWVASAAQRWGDLAELGLEAYPAETDEQAQANANAPFTDTMFWHMNLFAERQAEIGENAWLYEFAHQPPYPEGERALGAVHTAEIPYVFNNLAAPRVFPDGSSPELSSVSEPDIRLADIVSQYWVNFAATGDPNGPGLARWEPFSESERGEAMILDAEEQGMDEAITPAQLDLYDALYARQMADD